MSILRADFYSEALTMNTSAVIILPDDIANSRAKVLYLLHGLSDNCTGWMRLTGVERYARERKMAVVMPEVQRSFYTNMAYGVNYFSYVADELPQKMQKMFGFSSKQEKNMVAGLSMGGYGALKCALTYPERYFGCAAFSSACDMKRNIHERYIDPQRQRELQAIFGLEQIIPEKDDLFALLKKSADAPVKPRFFVTCGTDDLLLPQNHDFKAAMEALPYDLTYMEWKGDHTWDFWDRSILLALEHLVDGAKKRRAM